MLIVRWAIPFLVVSVRTDSGLQMVHTRPKSERTADIRTIFTKVDRVDSDTGKTITGNICTVCKYVSVAIVLTSILTSLPRDAGMTSKACFFTGGVSTLRAHISRLALYSCTLDLSYGPAQAKGPFRSLQGALHQAWHLYE
jgi:hypothetical protein